MLVSSQHCNQRSIDYSWYTLHSTLHQLPFAASSEIQHQGRRVIADLQWLAKSVVSIRIVELVMLPLLQ